MASYETKNAAEVKDYGVDWADILADGAGGTDRIEASAWTARPATIGLTALPPSFTETTAKVWLSGGEAGIAYTLTNTITTAGGRTFEQSFYCDVR